MSGSRKPVRGRRPTALTTRPATPPGPRRAIAAIAAIAGALAIAFAALSSPAAASPAVRPAAQATATPGAIVDVAIVDDAFVPDVITVTVGTTVRWTNRGQHVHSVSSDTGLFNWALSPGNGLRVRFLGAGTYRYHCVYHGAMLGRVVVVPAPPSPTPTPMDGTSSITPTEPAPGTPDATATATPGDPTPAPVVGPPYGPALGGDIVFEDSAAEGSRLDLFRVAADGTGRRALTDTPALTEAQPNWSPDHTQVVYTASTGQGSRPTWQIEAVDVATGTRRPITLGPYHFEPRWRPGGDRIAFTSVSYAGGEAASAITGSAIGVVRADGAGARTVVGVNGGSSVIGNPTWSPDGREIAFVVRTDRGSGFEGEIWAIDIASGAVRRLFAHPGWDDVHPAWSPDGTRITFASRRVGAGRTAPYAIWLLDLTTGVAGTVASHPDWPLSRPSWSPGGGWIIFNAEISPSPDRVVQLYYVQDGGGTIYGPLTSGAEPDWAGQTGFSPTEMPGATGTPEATPGPGTPSATAAMSTATPTATPSATFPPPPVGTIALPTLPAETAIPGPPPTFPAPSETAERATGTGTATPIVGTPVPTMTATMGPDVPTSTPSSGTSSTATPPSATATPLVEGTPGAGGAGRRVWLPVAYG
ncbi:MAG: cupredoxin domain-containing protein [Ardenticatenales bacterium]